MSTPQFNKFFRIIGFCTVVGLFQLAAYLGPLLWPILLKYKEDNNLTKGELYVTFALPFNIFILVTCNMAFYLIYHIEHPFFE